MEQKPEFFQVYIPQINSKKMGINDGFLATLPDGALPKRVILRNRAKKCYWVDVSKKKDGVYFDGGWEVFVKKNEIEVGYFLVFRYNDVNVFDVGIFDHSCCEKYRCDKIEVDKEI